MKLVCALARRFVDHRSGNSAEFRAIVAGGNVDLLDLFGRGQVDAEPQYRIRIVNPIDNCVVG